MLLLERHRGMTHLRALFRSVQNFQVLNSSLTQADAYIKTLRCGTDFLAAHVVLISRLIQIVANSHSAIVEQR